MMRRLTDEDLKRALLDPESLKEYDPDTPVFVEACGLCCSGYRYGCGNYSTVDNHIMIDYDFADIDYVINRRYDVAIILGISFNSVFERNRTFRDGRAFIYPFYIDAFSECIPMYELRDRMARGHYVVRERYMLWPKA